MKKTFFLTVLSVLTLSAACQKAPVKSDNHTVSIGMSDGTLYVTTMADDAIRVQYIPLGMDSLNLKTLSTLKSKKTRHVSLTRAAIKLPSAHMATVCAPWSTPVPG